MVSVGYECGRCQVMDLRENLEVRPPKEDSSLDLYGMSDCANRADRQLAGDMAAAVHVLC
jgi:hypothetical protein